MVCDSAIHCFHYWFLWWEENRSTRRKTLGTRTRTNNKWSVGRSVGRSVTTLEHSHPCVLVVIIGILSIIWFDLIKRVACSELPDHKTAVVFILLTCLSSLPLLSIPTSLFQFGQENIMQ